MRIPLWCVMLTRDFGYTKNMPNVSAKLRPHEALKAISKYFRFYLHFDLVAIILLSPTAFKNYDGGDDCFQ